MPIYSKSNPRYQLTPDAARKIFDAAGQYWGARNPTQIAIAVMWLTGSRPVEFGYLQKEHFIFGEGGFEIHEKTAKLRGDGGFKADTRVLRFDRPRGGGLNVYAETIRAYVEDLPPGGYLFAGKLTAWTLWSKLQKLGQEVLQEKLCAYSFRHSVYNGMHKGLLGRSPRLVEGTFSREQLRDFKGAADDRSVEAYAQGAPPVVILENTEGADGTRDCGCRFEGGINVFTCPAHLSARKVV